MAKKTKKLKGNYPDAFLDAPIKSTHRITITATCTKEWSERLVDVIRSLGGVDRVQVDEA
jgi:hypothetical protein